MSKIRFLNVPRKVRSLLNGKRFASNSKSLDLITANKKVKALAKKLNADQKINLNLEIEPDKDKKQVFTVSNIYIEHDDEQLGLRRIADRIVLDSTVDQKESESRLKLADLIEAELKDDDPESDSQNVGSDMDYMFSKKTEKSIEEHVIEKDEKERDTNEKTNDERSIGGVTPQDTAADTSIQRPSSDESNTVDHENTVESSLKANPNPSSFLPNQEDLKTYSENEINLSTTKSQEVISKSKYIAEKNLFQAVPDKNSKAVFDLQDIKKRLGYVDDPQDEYQQRLNRLIDRDIEKCHLKNAANIFEKEASKLKQDSITRLAKSYDEVNKSLLTETVEGLAGNDLKENMGAASKEKADTEQIVLDKKEAKLKELRDEAAKRIAEASDRINAEIKHREDTFNQEQNHWLEKRKSQIDTELKQKNLATKEKYRAKEIQKRNLKLQDIHQQVENTYANSLNKLFTRHQNAFATNLVHLERSVQAQAKQVARQKQKDDKQQAMLDQQKAKVTAINRSNELKEQELKYRQKHDQQYPEDFAKTVSDGLKKAIKEALADQQKTAKKDEDVEKLLLEEAFAKYLGIDGIDNPTEIEKSDGVKQEDEIKHKPHSKFKKRIAGITVGTLAVAILAAGGYEIYAKENSQPDLSELVAKNQYFGSTPHVSKPKKDVIKSSRANKQNKKVKKVTSKHTKPKKAKAPVKAGDSNVIRYHSTNSWSAKVDVLDGALGQGDIRALKEINDYHSTWISRLYYAIAANDESKIRKIYLKITPNEKQELSAAAKHAIALAFYNVHDWNNGWKARNGY